MSARSLFTAAPNYKFDGALGTNGKVLTSDGAGSTSWETPAETIDQGGVVQSAYEQKVTLNVKSGHIVLYQESLLANEWRSFVLMSDKITNEGDLVSVSITLNPDPVGPTQARLLAYVTKVEVGAAYITVENMSPYASTASAKWVTFMITNVGL